MRKIKACTIVAVAALGPLVLHCPVWARPTPDVHLTHQQATKDALKLVELLELSHPDPYTNMGGKIAFKRKAHDLLTGIPAQGLSVSELGDRLSAFVRGLHDGHTHIGPERWSDAGVLLPLDFEIARDGLFVSATDIQALKGTRGSQLVAVNGMPLEKIVVWGARELGAENLYGEYAAIEEILRSEELIRRLFAASGDSAIYTLRAPDGTLSDHRILWSEKRRWDRSTAIEKPVIWNRVEAPDLFYYRLLDEYSAAYLRVRTLMGREAYEDAWRNNWGNVNRMLEDYYRRQNKEMPEKIEDALRGVPSFLAVAEELLGELKRRNTTTLIVDLRGNAGGVTGSVYPFLYEVYGDRFYGRPSKTEWVTVESQLYLDKHHISAEERRREDPDFTVGNYRWAEQESGDARAKRERAMAQYARQNFSFAPRLAALNGTPLFTPKKVVVLCDPATFSAAFHFMFHLHELGARVVGVPSSQSPNAFMDMTEFQLPGSGLRGSISNSMQLFLPDNPHATVFHPDFEMDYSTFARYNFDKNAAVRFALDLVATGQI